MDRGEFLKLVALAPLAPSGRAGSTGPSVDRPNVLLVIADDMRADQMGALDPSLFVGGVSFSNAHVATPQCSPSRSSLLTGRYAHNTGQWHNAGSARRFKDKGLAYESLPYYLQTLGYRTAHFGKYLNGYIGVAPWIPPGYDRFVATLEDRAPVAANVQGKIKEARWWEADARPTGELVWRSRETEWLTSRCLQWMEAQTTPWFATLAVPSPHDPYTPTAEHMGSYSNVPMPKTAAYDNPDPVKPDYVRRGPLTNAEKAEIERSWRGQMEELAGVSDQLKRVRQQIDLDNTYLIFLSDNGYQMGEHRLYKKQRPYPESTRTPLRVLGPGVTERSTDLLVSSLDVPATIAALAGVEGAPFDGRSLAPILFAPPETPDPSDPDANAPVSAEEPEPWRSSMLVEQAQEYGPTYGAWKAIRSQAGDLIVEHSTAEREYYPASDPMQLSNAAASNIEAMDAFAARLSALRGASGHGLRAAEVQRG